MKKEKTLQFKERGADRVVLSEQPSESDPAFLSVLCPSCQQKVVAENIHLPEQISKCGHCNVIFPIHREVSDLIPPKKYKQEVIRPEGIDLFHYKNEIDITIQQPYWPLDIVSVVLSPLIALAFLGVFVSEGFNIILAIISVLFGPFTILSIFNLFRHSKSKIHIHVNKESLIMMWRPRRFNRDQVIRSEDIDQIYIKSMQGYSTFGVYAIVNNLEGQKHVKLVSSLKSKSKALYIEQEIEKHLGISDRPVPEEIS